MGVHMSSSQQPSKQAKQASGDGDELSPEADKFLAESTRDFTKKQRTFQKTWRTDDVSSYGFDQETGVLALEYADGSRVEAEAHVVGSYQVSDNTWEWAWHNPNVMPRVSKKSAAVKQFGNKFNINYLQAGKFEAPKPRTTMLGYLHAIGLKAMAAEGLYFAKHEKLEVVLAVMNPKRVREANAEMAAVAAKKAKEKPPVPDSRVYVHRKCSAQTIVDGDDFSALSAPMLGNAKTFCCKCKAHFPIADFVWEDTGESIRDFRDRWRQKVPVPLYFMLSGWFTLVVFFVCITVGPWLFTRFVSGGWLWWVMLVVGIIAGLIAWAIEMLISSLIIVRGFLKVRDWRELK